MIIVRRDSLGCFWDATFGVYVCGGLTAEEAAERMRRLVKDARKAPALIYTR